MEKANIKSLTVYVLKGSQFAAKVLAALDSRKIKHYVYFCSFQEGTRKKELPSGGTLVPELKAILQDGTTVIMPDSEAILHWLDANYDAKFFPTEEASKLSVRASNKVLTAALWYFNWVDEDGFACSMKAGFRRALFPSWMPFADSLVSTLLSSTRSKFRSKSMKALELSEEEIEDSTKIREMLIEELKYFQSFLLKGDEGQNYLLPGEEPTAADFSVYCQVERLFGETGDGKMLPALPRFREENAESLQRFWQWQDLMVEKHPIRFTGKREPKE